MPTCGDMLNNHTCRAIYFACLWDGAVKLWPPTVVIQSKDESAGLSFSREALDCFSKSLILVR